MTKRITPAQQDEAYDHGYRSCENRNRASLSTYVNPYDSDKYWLLCMAYQQGWNDRAEYERERAAKIEMAKGLMQTATYNRFR